MVTTVTREWGTLVDRKDKVQNIHSPESEYSKAAQSALGRKMDLVVMDGLLGTARTGEDGSGTQALGNAQKVASVAAGAIADPNVQLLRYASFLINQAEAEGTRILAHNSKFLLKLLANTEVASSDFNTVKALVQGEIDTYMGFKFVRLENLPLASVHDTGDFHFSTTTGLYSGGGTDLVGTEECAIAFIGDGGIFGKNPNMIARVDERADKGYSNQVYTAMDFGCTRMEEAKVVQLIYPA